MATDKTHKIPNAPNLRFPEFSGTLEKHKIAEVAPLQRGFDLPTQEIKKGEFPVVYSNGILRHHKHYKCEAPGLITGRSGTIGKFTFVENGKYWPHNTSLWVTDFCGNHPQYMYYLFQTINIEQYATGSGVPTLNRNDVHRHIVFVPSVDEQKKIAEFLSIVDERIATQIGAIEDYKRLKGYLIDKLIKQQDCTMKIGDVIAQKSERNRKGDDYTVLSVSNQKGFLAQSEQFEEREVASEDKSSYKIVRRDDFAYNPARINVGSIARLINYDCGIVSPMYICFHADKCVLPEFLGYFFESRCFATEVDKRLEGSVRLCLSYDGLCDIPIQIPDVEKQRAIIQKLDAVSQKIVLEEQCLDLYKQQKDYLLKNMFV